MNLSFYFINAGPLNFKGPFPVPLKSNITLLTSASAFISYCSACVKSITIFKTLV